MDSRMMLAKWQKPLVVGVLLFSLLLGLGLSVHRYFVFDSIVSSVSKLDKPIDVNRIASILDSLPLDDARRQVLLNVYHHQADGALDLKNLLITIATLGKDYSLSESVRWSGALLFLGLLLWVQKKATSV